MSYHRNIQMPGLSRLFAVIVTFFLLQAGTVRAADPEGMSQEQMQQMMENAQKMHQCFENIDQDALEKLAKAGRQVEGEIRSLCRAGKRAEAQARAMDYARKVGNSGVIADIRKCDAMTQGMLQEMPGMLQELKEESKSGNGHICDNM
jgi:predicted dinucleotide-binding enzyme